MAHHLILHASKYGHTLKIAQFISTELSNLGHTSDMVDCGQYHSAMNLSIYQGIIVGAPVYRGNYPKQLAKWIKANPQFKTQVPCSAFYSVCLGIMDQNEASVLREKEIVADFLDWNHWRPNSTAIFAGALNFTKYNWLLKRFMRRIAKKSGMTSTDITKNYDFTDWQAVRKFTQDFSNQVLQATQQTVRAQSAA